MLMSSRGTRRIALVVGAVLAGSIGGCSGCGGKSDSNAGITATPTAIVFTEPFTGKTYTQVVTITSSGTGDLDVLDIAVEDTTSGGGVLSLAVPFEPFTLPKGQTREVTLQLATASEASPAGTIHFTSNADDLDIPITSARTDEAELTSCVLTGATVGDGCEVDGSSLPTMSLGDTPLGTAVNRVVALSNLGAGSVPVAITGMAVVPALDAGTHFTVELFTLDTEGNEVARTLPFYLNPPDASDASPATELRARVIFDALVAQGAIPAVSLEVTTRHPAGTLTIPISGNVTACATGTADCDDNPATGCEITTATDLANCGACGSVCGSPNAAPTCTDGVCALNCNADYDSCDGDKANGCETNLAIDLANCGDCGMVCDPANGTPNCVAGVCGVASCGYGFADCNFNVADGCETNLSSDPNHCGSCTTACSTPNGTPGCLGGTCTISSCNTNYQDCDGSVATGCESFRLTDSNNCGYCGRVCTAQAHTASTYCSAASCSILTCQAGWYDADGVYSNGCEAQPDAWDLAGNGNTCPGIWHGYVYDADSSSSPRSLSITGNIVPASDVDYYYFLAYDQHPGGRGFDLDVHFASNPNNLYKFDIFRGGTSSVACASTRLFGPITQYRFETNFTWRLIGSQMTGMQDCITDPSGYFVGSTAHCDNYHPAANQFFVVKVYRPDNSMEGTGYTLHVENGY